MAYMMDDRPVVQTQMLGDAIKYGDYELSIGAYYTR